ncbi:MAG: protein kinase [Vicinamibacteria bacterium]|nr:protein kinase [Vicinamibacteria bacterium]
MPARPAPADRAPDEHRRANESTAPGVLDLKTALTLTHTPAANPDGGVEDLQRGDRAPSIPEGVVLNGRYRIERLLGRGGMGAVYRVDDQLYPGRPTALKLFLRQLTHSVDLFRAEFKTMASLRHPNVARVYDFEMVAGLDAFFFTMELLNGSTLGRTLQQSGEEKGAAALDGAGTLPWREAVDLLVPVIRALAYLHKRSVVHFDLKPSNIMVGPSRPGRQVKVLDFGLAGLRGATGQVMGTPEYLSPEIARRAKSDHRSDLYSLGVMGYQLLTGRVPYDTTGSVPELLRQKTTERVRFGPGEKDTVPAWLRESIERLCAIDPEERHQTAEQLLDELNRAGGLAYELETQDTKESYLFSSQFVGRRRELEEVQRFIDAGLEKRVQGGLLIAGRSGMGKSRLMREVRQAVQLRGVPFLEADCFERDLSESGPMANLVLQAAGLARSVEGHALLARYGPEMVKLVPSLALEPGVTPTPPLENADAERRRMIEAVAEFLTGLGRLTPYVAYVNDLQWAREGTIDLMGALLRLRSEKDASSGLCFLGSYRSDDLGDRPLSRLLASSTARASIGTVELTPLDNTQVSDLLQSMLGLNELPEGLAEGVAGASGGLPFFVEEILRDLLEEGRLALLRGDGASGARAVAGLRFDAAASFLKRAARVSREERLVLDVLAVCGRPAEPAVISRVTGLSAPAVQEALQVLTERQMVVAVAGARERHNLAHDRMREALYASLPGDERSALHLSLARSLADSLDEGERGETLFETVGHFDQALRLLPSEPVNGVRERTAVARLHLRAALATNATGAFESGVAHLERAKALLPRQAFEHEYPLALAIEHALASTLIPLGRIDEALSAADRIVSNAKSVLDEAPGFEARILGHTARNEYPKAIAAGLEICRRLGMSLPESPTLLDIAWNIGQVMWQLRGRTDEELVTLPRMTDERATRLIRILTSMNSGAYVTRPYLWPILISRSFILTLRHGRGPTHALRFAWFATALCAVGAYRTSIRFSRLSTRLMDAPDGAAFLPKIHHAMGQFLSHWRDPMTRSVEWCRTGVIMGERVEDAEFTGYCHMGWAKASLDAGTPLPEVRKTCLDALETIRAAGQRGTEVMHRPTLEAVETLMGLAPLSDDVARDDHADAALSNAQNGFRLLDKTRVLCFFRRNAALSLGDDVVRVTTVGLPATFYFSIAHYFAALGWLLAVRAPGAGLGVKLAGLLRAWRIRWTLARWARSCPQNFEHRFLLVEAEWLRTLGRRRRAIRRYEEAVAAAREYGFIQDAALASELMAEAYLEMRNERDAIPHLVSALSGYAAWGADAKVRDLKTRYARLLA